MQSSSIACADEVCETQTPPYSYPAFECSDIGTWDGQFQIHSGAGPDSVSDMCEVQLEIIDVDVSLLLNILVLNSNSFVNFYLLKIFLIVFTLLILTNICGSFS